MESIEHPYRIQQVLLIILGLWPYNDTLYRRVQRIFFIILISFSIFLQIGKIVTSTSNLENFLQVLSFAIPCLVVTLKYATFCIKSEDLKKLIEQINNHWNSIKCKEELKILQQCSYFTKLLSITVTVLFYLVVCFFLMTQILPKFLDIVIPLNESRPLKLLGLTTFLFDQDEYFVLIFVHMALALSVEVTTVLATETMGAVYIQHAYGLFRITSLRIKHAFDCEIQISASEKYKIYYTNIINALTSHIKAIEYFDLFNSSLEISAFILLVLGVASLSLNLFRLYQAGFKKDFEEAILIAIFVIVHFVYMFLNNFMTQLIINYSEDIFYKTCELPWYSVPISLQKLLLIIMQRSLKYSKFTICSVIEASLEFFASLVNCSLSYFMMFLSLQH